MNRLLLLELSPELAGHLAVAVELYRRELRRAKGWAGPESLEALGALALKSASGRQDATTVADVLDVLQHRPVALLVGVGEASELLGVSKRTVERLIAAGTLAAVKVEGRTLLRRADLVAYVDSLGPRPMEARTERKAAG